MANINIAFNNKNYLIDSTFLADALASLEAHFMGMVGENPDVGNVITWDGNTEGRLSFLDAYYKVSDLVLTHEEIRSATVEFSNGESMAVDEYWDSMNKWGMITEGYVTIPSGYGGVLIAMADNVDFGGGDFIPERGIYFAALNGTYVSKLTIPSTSTTPVVL